MPTGSWVHAYLHRKEGDLCNAGYWYRRAGRPESRHRAGCGVGADSSAPSLGRHSSGQRRTANSRVGPPDPPAMSMGATMTVNPFLGQGGRGARRSRCGRRRAPCSPCGLRTRLTARSRCWACRCRCRPRAALWPDRSSASTESPGKCFTPTAVVHVSRAVRPEAIPAGGDQDDRSFGHGAVPGFEGRDIRPRHPVVRSFAACAVTLMHTPGRYSRSTGMRSTVHPSLAKCAGASRCVPKCSSTTILPAV